MEKSLKYTVPVYSKLKLLPLLFLGIFLQNLEAQTTKKMESLKGDAIQAITWYYHAAVTIANISCHPNRVKDKSIYAITSGHFMENSKIYVSYLDVNRIPEGKNYFIYFDRLSRLCSVLYKEIEYEIVPVKIDNDQIRCLENTCTVEVKVRQKFSAIRKDGSTYCDVTTKTFEIKNVYEGDNYRTVITEVRVLKTNPCGDAL